LLSERTVFTRRNVQEGRVNPELEEYLREAVLPEFGPQDLDDRHVRRHLNEWLHASLEDFSSYAARDLEAFGYLEDGRITPWGWRRLRRLLRWNPSADTRDAVEQ